MLTCSNCGAHNVQVTTVGADLYYDCPLCNFSEKKPNALMGMLKANRKKGSKMSSKRYEMWSEAEVDFLQDNYRDMTDEKLGAELNRSPSSVCTKRMRLGLSKS